MEIFIASNLSNSPPPSVGIFWSIVTHNRLTLVCHGSPLPQAESYGDMLTHSFGHAELWESWQRLGATALARQGLPPLIATTDYDQHPRGRIVHDTASHQFILYADRKLQTPTIVSRLLAAFGLTADNTSIQSDAHYRS